MGREKAVHLLQEHACHSVNSAINLSQMVKVLGKEKEVGLGREKAVHLLQEHACHSVNSATNLSQMVKVLGFQFQEQSFKILLSAIFLIQNN